MKYGNYCGVCLENPCRCAETAEILINDAIVNQSMPTGEGTDVIEQVIVDMELRAQKGVETYGTRLKTNNGRNALVDAYQEALDLAIYLKQRLLEEQ